MLKKLNRSNIESNHQHPVKVLQFGEGNFLRAFVDWMIDVMNEKVGFNGSIQIIQPLENGMGQMINEQEGLYHVILNGIKNGNSFQVTRLITSVKEVINPHRDFNAFLKTAENPDLEFVISNTTEAGITFDELDQSMSTLPKTFPGKLTLLLHHRFTFYKGDPNKALVIIPCELIDKNGLELKKTILQYIQLWNLSDDFKQWIESHTIFCNTLVDRIVPGFPKDKIDEIQKHIGFDDKLVVTAEPFHLWIIEGPEQLSKRFPAPQAGLDVKFVQDQSPYRTRKVRILNGAHTAMVPVAYLQGLRTVLEAVEHETTGKFIREAIHEEIIPTLDLPVEELQQFAQDVIERFQNPFIRHELQSIALNSVSKYQVRVLPSVMEYIKRKNALPKRLLFALAALIRFYKGELNGEIIPLKDTPDVLNFMRNAWSENDGEKAALKILANKSFWIHDLTKINGLAEFVIQSIQEIENEYLVNKV